MKSFFANVWTKRVVFVLSVVYTYFVFRLCYLSIFYNITVHERTSLCLALSGLSLVREERYGHTTRVRIFEKQEVEG